MSFNEKIKEKNFIKNMISFESLEKDIFCLDFRLTSKCNYNCWYCTDMHNNKEKTLIFSIKNYKELITKLDQDIRLFLYGGEPTLHPQFIDIVKCSQENLSKNSIIEIQTNLSFPTKKLELLISKDIMNYPGKPTIKFLVSYHYGECSFKNFIKNCLILYRHKLLDQVAVMYQKKHEEIIMKNMKIMKNMFTKTSVELLPTLCGSVKENMERPYEDIDNFYKNKKALELAKNSYSFKKRLKVTLKDGSTFLVSSFDLWHNRQNTFRNMVCHVGLERLIINSNGNVYHCFNNLFDENTDPLFNINDKIPEKINFKKIKCIYDKCYFDFNHKRYIP